MILTDECAKCFRETDVKELFYTRKGIVCFSCRPPNSPRSEETKARLNLARQKVLEYRSLELRAKPTKVCTKCKEEKPKDMFWRNRKSLDGRNTRCAKCALETFHKWKAYAYRPLDE